MIDKTKYAAVICGGYIQPYAIEEYQKAFPTAKHWLIDMPVQEIVFFNEEREIVGRVKQMSSSDFIKFEPLSNRG